MYVSFCYSHIATLFIINYTTHSALLIVTVKQKGKMHNEISTLDITTLLLTSSSNRTIFSCFTNVIQKLIVFCFVFSTRPHTNLLKRFLAFINIIYFRKCISFMRCCVCWRIADGSLHTTKITRLEALYNSFFFTVFLNHDNFCAIVADSTLTETTKFSFCKCDYAYTLLRFYVTGTALAHSDLQFALLKVKYISSANSHHAQNL